MENIDNPGVSSQESFDVNVDNLDAIQVGTEGKSSETSDVHSNNGKSPAFDINSVQIDERFKDLSPEEGRLRTLQSQRDSTNTRYESLMRDYEERDKIATLLDQMVEDEGLFMAFVHQLKPDLIKTQDLHSQLKTQLQKEFGEEYKPTLTREEAERDDPFGQDARYYMRVTELRSKLLNSNTNEGSATTIKEYLARKREREEADAEKQRVELDKVKSQFKMSDQEVKAISDWALNLKFDQLVKIHRFLRRFPTQNPNITNAPGSSVGEKTEREKFLDTIVL